MKNSAGTTGAVGHFLAGQSDAVSDFAIDPSMTKVLPPNHIVYAMKSPQGFKNSLGDFYPDRVLCHWCGTRNEELKRSVRGVETFLVTISRLQEMQDSY